MVELMHLSDITLGYHHHDGASIILRIADLKVYKNHWTMLYGPSGSGKTTLLAALAGCGHILSGGISLYYDAREMAYMPQAPCLLEGLSVRDNITMLAYLRKRHMVCEVEELADACALSCILDQSIVGLSGGERMKISLMRSLLMGPKVFFLDEPSCHWDTYNTQRIMDALKSYQSKHDMSIVMVSHDVDLRMYSDACVDVRAYHIGR